MRSPFLVAGSLVASLAFAAPAHAETLCDCVVPSEDGAMGAKVVFTGTLTRITSGGAGMVMHFRVQKRFWGPVDAQMAISDSSPGVCLYPFQMGHAYLVYGYQDENDGAGYSTDACSPNLPLDKASDRIRDLTAFVVHARQNPMEYHFGGR